VTEDQKNNMSFVGRLIKPYQDEGVRWMTARDKEGGGFLCDEMGLGKTAQTIAMMCNNPGRTLVVAPKSVTAQWNNELDPFRANPQGRHHHVLHSSTQ
jgi:SNF2 family DNA or RNA helicase